MAKVKTGFTAQLRDRLEEALEYKPCKTCGHVQHNSVRTDADRIGIPMNSLYRFLKGKPPRAKTIDAIVAFLEKKGAQG